MSSQDGRYRLFGAELSPYSIKVRSYLRYKQLPHDWIVRSQANEDEFRGLAKLPLVPLLVMPDGSVLQDSTPIIERLEQVHPEPSIHPPGPVAAFVSALLEEYGDEWGNKPMFHYRWAYEPDQASAARRIAGEMMPGIDKATLAPAVEMVRARMVPRLSFVGSSDATRPAIEGSFLRLASILEEHLAGRPYVFGGRPAFADFGLYPQIRQAATDPTARCSGSAFRGCSPGRSACSRRARTAGSSRGRRSPRRSRRCCATRSRACSFPGPPPTRRRWPRARRSSRSISPVGPSGRRRRSTTRVRSTRCAGATRRSPSARP
jgi:glutathione S-transferase